MDHITVFAPASVANVSCGFDALGFCLETVGDVFYIKKTDEKGISDSCKNDNSFKICF